MSLKRSIFIGFAITVIALVSMACSLSGGVVNDQSARDTQVAETVNAYLTKSAFETIIVEITEGVQPTSTLAPTQAPATATPMPPATNTPLPPNTNTPEPTATNTPLPPTATNTPLPPTATYTPLPCNWAEMVKDVTVPDGTVFYPDSVFTKVWRLKNIGSCTWNKDYSVVFSDGNQMGATTPVKLGVTVKPGETVDISLKMQAPSNTGTYRGDWMMRTDDNVLFGVGANGKSSFWVSIKVQDRPDFDADYKLQFYKNVKAATWSSLAGVLTPDTYYDFDLGSVSYVANPKLEDGYQDDEPAIVMVPNSGSNGRVRGIYPGITIQDGDRFQAVIGCISGYKKCDVTFKLSYQIENNDPVELGTWHQIYDDKWDKLNIDLSALKDKKVKFIFTVYSNDNSVDDVAFWLSPRIVRK